MEMEDRDRGRCLKREIIFRTPSASRVEGRGRERERKKIGIMATTNCKAKKSK
jgi:hypothetical protein